MQKISLLILCVLFFQWIPNSYAMENEVVEEDEVAFAQDYNEWRLVFLEELFEKVIPFYAGMRLLGHGKMSIKALVKNIRRKIQRRRD